MRLVPTLLVGSLLVSSCGYVGEPLPPALNLPIRVTDLAAAQRGSKIIVQFTIAPKTTEGLLLKHSPDVDLRVGPSPTSPFSLQGWVSANQPQPGGPHQGAARYEIPIVTQWIGKDVVIGVRLRNQDGKDAGWSNLAALKIISALPVPEDVRAEAAPTGVRLSWSAPLAPGYFFRVFRRMPPDAALSPLNDPDKTTYLDETAEFGKRYNYFVQTLEKVNDKIAESDISAEASITPIDVFPPTVPRGLVAVAGTRSIELVWDRNTEPDLAGYRVFRAETGDFAQIAETGEPSYSDRSVVPGKNYRYAVSAFDKSASRNESKRSEPVQASLP